MATREQAVAQAKSWHGLKESDGSFKPIIDHLYPPFFELLNLQVSLWRAKDYL